MVGTDSKTQSVIIEVDHKSHYSDTATHKDNIRDKHFLKKGIPTIRFKLKDIIGKKPWSDKEILSLIDAEIEYQLSRMWWDKDKEGKRHFTWLDILWLSGIAGLIIMLIYLIITQK